MNTFNDSLCYPDSNTLAKVRKQTGDREIGQRRQRRQRRHTHERKLPIDPDVRLTLFFIEETHQDSRTSPEEPKGFFKLKLAFFPTSYNLTPTWMQTCECGRSQTGEHLA